ncbi:hypothetical protein FOL47_010006 [Perkinsus chesapeaki]|uniref:Uncharacterized protein n=1 Tax=Perkinsus chesapeaki TaxID=330153 RepID=A0A7J6MQG9_PERCH|nr:hypothetical protein FOL47_010006 [Perkinsus chesapeaki]
MEHDLISAEMQVDGQPSILLAAVEHKSPKSLADLTSIFSMNQPNCTIELSPLKPYSARVHWNGHIYSGTVSKEYPYTITWANGEGVGLLLELPEWYNVLKPESSNPYFILAEYRPTGGTPQRVLMRHAGKYWTDDRLRRWVEDVNKHEPYPV